jgi:hypothetical protein
VELQRPHRFIRDDWEIAESHEASATKDISAHGSKLLKTHVTRALASALADEQKLLVIDSIQI